MDDISTCVVRNAIGKAASSARVSNKASPEVGSALEAVAAYALVQAEIAKSPSRTEEWIELMPGK